MADPGERQRTVLRAPRVEFDLSALALGAAGYLAYQWVWFLLAALLQVPKVGDIPPWLGLRSEFFLRVFGGLKLPFSEYVLRAVGWPGQISYKAGDKDVLYNLDLPWWKLAVVGAALLILWSLVAGAIARVYAVRIARDESIGAGEGLAFSLGNLRAFLQAPLFVAAAAGFFLGLAALAGAVTAIPYAGPFLEIVLYPLALVAGLVVTVIAVGGIFGLPVMQAALATEKNGTLDAISRTFSYVFTRPVAYLVALVMVTIVSTVIATFGGYFIDVTGRAMMWGASWNADPNAPIDAMRAIGGGIAVGIDQRGLFGWPTVQNVDGLSAMWVYVTWAVTALAALAIHGYVLSYFVGGLTDTYFLLRREVDGIDDSEVYVEGAEAKLSGPVPGEPQPPAGS